MSTLQQDEFTLAHRRHQVTELYLQGWSQTSIAVHLGVSQSTVSEDIQRVRDEWRASDGDALDAIRARELAKIDMIEREAWSAWARSQKPAQSAVVTGEGVAKQTKKSVKHQIGDPRFLDQVSKCVAQRRALLGLDPVAVISPVEGHFDVNVSLEVRRQRVVTLLAAIGDRHGVGPSGVGPDGGQPGGLCAGDEPRALEDGSTSNAAGPGNPGHADGT